MKVPLPKKAKKISIACFFKTNIESPHQYSSFGPKIEGFSIESFGLKFVNAEGLLYTSLNGQSPMYFMR